MKMVQDGVVNGEQGWENEVKDKLLESVIESTHCAEYEQQLCLELTSHTGSLQFTTITEPNRN